MFGTVGEFVLAQIGRPAIWYEQEEQTEGWTVRTAQAETWTERTEQVESWTER